MIRLTGDGNWTVAVHEGGLSPVPAIRFGPSANNAPKRSLRLTSTNALQYSHIASQPAALLSLITEGFGRFRAVRSNGNATMITGVHLEHCGCMSIKPASSWQSGSAKSRNSNLDTFVLGGHKLGRFTIECSGTLWKDSNSTSLDEREWADMLKIRLPKESLVQSLCV